VEPLNKGNSVSLSADGTTIVGGPGDSNGQGAAWVYAPSGSVWTQQGSKLVSTVASGAAQQGSSVAVSSGGNTAIAIVGGPGDSNGQGAAWVYRRTPGLFWMEGPSLSAQARVQPPNRVAPSRSPPTATRPSLAGRATRAGKAPRGCTGIAVEVAEAVLVPGPR
jgi:hypothetical protein